MRILLSSSFLRHCDETKTLLYRIPSICLIGADAGQKERDKVAALKFLKKAIKRFGNPEAITTDGLRSYTAAMTELGNADKQQIGRWANNRVENSHSVPTTRASDAAVQANELLTEVRLGPRQRPQPLQLRTSPRRQINLQATPLGSICRVAGAVQLILLVIATHPPNGDKCALV